jgi:ATP-dependent exoDNAse (exonuclease V) alpha subunit
LELTKDQKETFDHIMVELGATKTSSMFLPSFQYNTIGGFAGTGKTFLISVLRQELYNNWNHLKVAFATFTGKACNVLQVKLHENNSIFAKDTCSTIHRLMYIPEFGYDKKSKKKVVTKWVRRKELECNLIIIDEASMVNRTLWNDLLEYEVPIIAVGDHGQLPPIEDNDHNKFSFNLMEKPKYLLTEIKRQALENPIIRLSQDVRNGKEIPIGPYDENNPSAAFNLKWKSKSCENMWDKIDFSGDDIITICGTNETRVHINNKIRNKLGFTRPEPYPGERVIFLKNNYDSKVFNGMLGKVLFLLYEAKNVYDMTIQPDDYENPFAGLVYNGCFGKEKYDDFHSELQNYKYIKIIKESEYGTIDVCDYGYCITTHKSQGSEFSKVICFDEKDRFGKDEMFRRRWLYTAVTRAKDKLFLITN